MRSSFRVAVQQWLGTGLGACALFVSLGGPAAASDVAYASARLITGGSVRDGSLEAKDLSASARRSLRGQKGLRGAVGPQGAPGTPGTAGAQGAPGAPGATGPAGAGGSSGTLRSPDGSKSISVLNEGIVLLTEGVTMTLDPSNLLIFTTGSTSVNAQGNLTMGASATARLSGSVVNFGSGACSPLATGTATGVASAPGGGAHTHSIATSSTIQACQ